MTTRTDIYETVTNKIIDQLERGIRPWQQPWNAEHAAGRITRPLRWNGVPYSGVNILMLWASAMEQSFASPFWMTFKQAQELGGHVRKGEHGTTVVYASAFTKTELDANGEEQEERIPFLKTYTVFGTDQIEGLPTRFTEITQAIHAEPLQRIERAQQFFDNTGADVRTSGSQAYYSCGGDYVQMPDLQAFRDVEAYESTLAHELVHWTKHASRQNREFGRKRFGDEGYAMEELVAELGASFVCADLRIEPEVREDHSQYVGHWLKVLKNDKRAIFTAASHASKAVDYLHSLQPVTTLELATA